jgi:hypothetical protein
MFFCMVGLTILVMGGLDRRASYCPCSKSNFNSCRVGYNRHMVISWEVSSCGTTSTGIDS